MKFENKNIAVVGTGLIGSGWVIRFLNNDKKVFVYDPNKKQKNFLLSEIKRTSKILKKIYKKSFNIKKQLVFCKSIDEAVRKLTLFKKMLLKMRKLK